MRVEKEFITTKPMRAYKRVGRIWKRTKGGLPFALKNKFESPVPISVRSRQDGCRTDGKILLYQTGRIVESPIPRTAGIFLHRYKKYITGNIIRVSIPKGTKVRASADGRILAAAKIKVDAFVGHVNQFRS